MLRAPRSAAASSVAVLRPPHQKKPQGRLSTCKSNCGDDCFPWQFKFSQVEAPYYLAGIPNSLPSSCNMLGPVLSEARTAAVMPCRFNGVRGIVKARRQLCLGLDRAGRRCGRRDTRCNMSTRRRSRHGISCLCRPHHLPVLGFPLELKHLST